MNDDHEEGWCGGHTVFMADGASSSVLGPDGEPVKYIRRHVAGFDLRPRPSQRPRATPTARSRPGDGQGWPKQQQRNPEGSKVKT